NMGTQRGKIRTGHHDGHNVPFAMEMPPPMAATAMGAMATPTAHVMASTTRTSRGTGTYRGHPRGHEGAINATRDENTGRGMDPGIPTTPAPENGGDLPDLVRCPAAGGPSPVSARGRTREQRPRPGDPCPTGGGENRRGAAGSNGPSLAERVAAGAPGLPRTRRHQPRRHPEPALWAGRD